MRFGQTNEQGEEFVVLVKNFRPARVVSDRRENFQNRFDFRVVVDGR